MVWLFLRFVAFSWSLGTIKAAKTALKATFNATRDRFHIVFSSTFCDFSLLLEHNWLAVNSSKIKRLLARFLPPFAGSPRTFFLLTAASNNVYLFCQCHRHKNNGRVVVLTYNHKHSSFFLFQIAHKTCNKIKRRSMLSSVSRPAIPAIPAGGPTT